MAIKIGIAGTHSTGKSTFIHSLSKTLISQGYSIATVGNFATEAKKRGFPTLRDHTFKSTLWIITFCISQELEAELSSDIVLVDRPVIDAMGYLYAALNYSNRKILADEGNYLTSIVKFHSLSYNLLFKTVLNKKIELGLEKERDADLLFREMAAKSIDDAFANLKIPFYPISQVNLAESESFVLVKIKDLLSVTGK